MATKTTAPKKPAARNDLEVHVHEFKGLRDLGTFADLDDADRDYLMGVLEDLINDEPMDAAAKLYDVLEPWMTEGQRELAQLHIGEADSKGDGADDEEDEDALADDAD